VASIRFKRLLDLNLIRKAGVGILLFPRQMGTNLTPHDPPIGDKDVELVVEVRLVRSQRTVFFA
jgi:hypothetical protein